MGTHNICFYKEADIKYTGCNLKTTELLDCTLIGVFAVIRSNTVSQLTFFLIPFALYAMFRFVFLNKDLNK